MEEAKVGSISRLRRKKEVKEVSSRSLGQVNIVGVGVAEDDPHAHM